MSSALGGNVSQVVCDQFSTDYDAVTAGICATLCVFGFVYVFFGYRCFSAVMFLSGLIFGGTTVFMVCREERIFQQQFSIEIAAGIAAGIGVLCGFVTMLVRYVGLFLQGFFLGLLIAIAGILTLQAFYNPSTAWIPIGILFGVGILFSLLTLKFQKCFVIIGTAVLGSALIAVCIDYFLEQFLLLRYIWEALMAERSENICWYTWIILGVWPVLAFAGALLQWKVTSKGFDHTDVIISRGRRKQVRTHLVRERRRPTSRSTSRSTSRPARRQQANRNRSTSGRRRRAPPNDRGQVAVVNERQSSRTRSEVTASGARRQQTTGNPPPAAAAAAAAATTTTTNDDDLPTYFECVELGVGEPITERHEVVRTDSGAYVAKRKKEEGTRSSAGAPSTGNIQDDILRALDSGDGYNAGAGATTTTTQQQQQPSTSGYVDNAQLRRSQRQSGARSGASNRPQNRENINKFSRRSGSARQSSRNSPALSRSASGQSNRPGSKRFKRSTKAQSSARSRRQVQEGDTQRLLTAEQNRPRGRASHGDAVAAHARRITAAQKRKSLPVRGSAERVQDANVQPTTSSQANAV